MAYTEISKEVSEMIAIEEKCGLDMSSNQDLPKPDYNGTNHHNQAHDLDNSYVFVTGSKGLPDNVDNKNVEVDRPSVLPQSDADGVTHQGTELNSQNEKFNAVSGEFRPLNEAENRNEQSNRDSCLVNVDTKDVEAKGSSVLPVSDAAGVKDQWAELVSARIQNFDAVSGELQPMNDGENRNVEQSNRDSPFVSVDNKDVEADDLSVLPESDAAGVKDQRAELSSQNENFDAASGEFQPLNEVRNRNLEQTHGDPSLVDVDNKDVEAEGLSVMSEYNAAEAKIQGAELDSAKNENLDAVSGEFQAMNEVENGNVEQSDVVPPLVNVDNMNVEIKGLSVLPESDAVVAKDQGEELDSQNEKFDAIGGEFHLLNEVENRNIEMSDVRPTLVNDNTSKHESSHVDGVGIQVSVSDSLGEHTGETENSAEAEIGQVKDSDGEIESLAETEVEMAMDQNGKVEQKLGDDVKPESPPGPVENQEPQVDALSFAESEKNGESTNILLHINSSHSAHDECEDQSSLSTTEALEPCQGSHDVVVNVGSCESQDLDMDAEDELKLAREVASHEVSLSASLDLDLESYPVHSKDEALGREAKTTLSLDVLENQQGGTAVGNNVQGALGLINESKSVASSNDPHVQTVCDLILEQKNEDCCVSEIGNGVKYPEEPDKQPDGNGASETTTEASAQTQSYPPSNANVPQNGIEISDAQTIGAVSSTLTDGPRSQIIEKVLPGYDNGIRCATEASLDTVVLTGRDQAFQYDESYAETEVSSGKNNVADSRLITVGVKLETEVNVHNFSVSSKGDKIDDGAFSCITEVVEGIEDMGDQLDVAAGNSDENLFVQGNENSEDSHSNNISVASAGCFSSNMSGEEESIKIKTKPFNFLIRIPRFDAEDLREQTRLAKLLVDEKTKLRDAIQVQIQEKRAHSQTHGIDYEYAKSEARGARKLVRSKRMEIDSLQSVINKAKNALSIEDIDSQIYNMERMIQHETLPLKEEKQLIREIKQLKQLREQLSSNMGSQDEIKQALEQREEIEERLKILRKELDILKNKVLKAEVMAAQAEKKYDDENKKIKELQAQFRAADDIRQAAYAQWQNLRKELAKKSKHFFKYKDAAAVASNYAFSRDTEALYLLSRNQVENFMELWNTNKEFRREYARFNVRSTVRRFGTLDGRALRPDEKPHILPSYADERINKMTSTPVKIDLASQIPHSELKQEATDENVTIDGKSREEVTEPKEHKGKKGPAITLQANGLDTLSGLNLIDEVYEEPIKSRVGVESIRKEEEIRREEAEAELKEQRRLEALAKANEARERKKRQAEKLQLRAELKTLKEAEQREKEREKRLRKKERKKAAVTDANDSNNNCESDPISESAVENSNEIEVKDMPSVAPKKPQKPWLSAKQSKAKSVPPSLRNRNKKKLQQWMWVGVTSIIILVLFWLGNVCVFSNVVLKRRGHLH